MDKLTTAERELKERELEIRETLCWLFTKLSLVDYEAAIGDVKEMAAGWQARAGEPRACVGCGNGPAAYCHKCCEIAPGWKVVPIADAAPIAQPAEPAQPWDSTQCAATRASHGVTDFCQLDGGHEGPHQFVW